MIALILAMALNLFTLVAPPAGIPAASTFALNSYTTDSIGNRTVTTTAPTLGIGSHGLALDVSFIAPLKGTCLVGDIVNVNSIPNVVSLGEITVNKNATEIASLTLPTEDQIVAAGGSADGYTVFVICDPDNDTDGSKAVFSNFYHINAPATQPA